MRASPVEAAGKLLRDLLDPDVVPRVVVPDATAVFLDTGDADGGEILPWVGTSHGHAHLHRLTGRRRPDEARMRDSTVWRSEP